MALKAPGTRAPLVTSRRPPHALDADSHVERITDRSPDSWCTCSSRVSCRRSSSSSNHALTADWLQVSVWLKCA